MEKFLPEKITAYQYVVEERNGDIYRIITKQHFLSASEIASTLGIKDRRIIKIVLDTVERYPKYYFQSRIYDIRVYSPMDIFILIDCIIKFSKKSKNKIIVCNRSLNLLSNSPLNKYIETRPAA